MKGDDRRADLLAAFLAGGPLADEIEPFLPAVRRVRAVLDRLAPDPERVESLAQMILTAPRRAPGLFDRIPMTILFVADVERSVRFYTEVMGFTPRFREADWAELDAGNITLAIHGGAQPAAAEPSGEARRPAGVLTLGFTVSDIHGTVAHLRERGVRIVTEPAAVPFGWLARIADPDGLVITLAQYRRRPPARTR